MGGRRAPGSSLRAVGLGKMNAPTPPPSEVVSSFPGWLQGPRKETLPPGARHTQAKAHAGCPGGPERRCCVPWGPDVPFVWRYSTSFIHSPRGLGQRPVAKSPEVQVAYPRLLPQPCCSGQFGVTLGLSLTPGPTWAASAHPDGRHARGAERRCSFRLSAGAGPASGLQGGLPVPRAPQRLAAAPCFPCLTSGTLAATVSVTHTQR